MNDIKSKLTFFVTLMVSFTLCVVVIGMVGVLMAGLFNPLVDNAEIFAPQNIPQWQPAAGRAAIFSSSRK